MTTQTSPNLRPAGSTPLRIPSRPAWQTALLRAVVAVLDSTATTVALMAAILLAFTLIGAGYL